ncbi:MAG: transketolase, partial [Bacteroidetes bacterium GWA2_31_9]
MNFDDFKNQVIADYKLANISRELSILGRKEALMGRAKFGIFGDGKEIAQIALAKVFQNGDFRSGYYRDQTLMMAIGEFTAEEFFAQLYGNPDLNDNPGTAGRIMNNHFATRSLDETGNWKDLTKQKNSSPDISPTAGQMPRLLGLALASKIYRNEKELQQKNKFSVNGNEVAFGTIGDASTSEGHFFETINAAGVLQVPMAISVWDDGYGISVPKKFQTTKQSISELLKGFEKEEDTNGYKIFKGKGWDYPGLCQMYEEGIKICREQHIPVLFHIEEMTQPLGHSTSGSHERYKSAERLQWEIDFDPIIRMREWILSVNISTENELDSIENEAKEIAKVAKNNALDKYLNPIKKEREELLNIISSSMCHCVKDDHIKKLMSELSRTTFPQRKDNTSTVKKILRYICQTCDSKKPLKENLLSWKEKNKSENAKRYNSFLYCESAKSALKVSEVKPIFNESSPLVNGREILRDNFDILFSKYPELVTFGEDTGSLGDVNQGLEGLQAKYGDIRITDTGIRENTIVGQGIGLALRGLRPIAEIQYFDYLLYGLQTLSDDLATIHYRTKGGQKAPVIIRTRGHRLVGIWHSGSPLSMVINSIRGMYVCVPRNLTQAAGFYNTLLESDDPALVIEPLNAYRLKEKVPLNLGEFKIPLGVPEIIEEGTDITIVTYGSCVRIALDAVEQLKEFKISCELIDVQTLLPFDINNLILESIKKTGKVLFFDEDVPGGATAYMMQKVVEGQGAFYYLDTEPKTLCGNDHRPAYSADGDY